MPSHVHKYAAPWQIVLRGRQTEKERTRGTVRGNKKTRERETNRDRKNERDSERG